MIKRIFFYKEKILKAARGQEKDISHRGIEIRMTADFSSETEQARRQVLK